MAESKPVIYSNLAKLDETTDEDIARQIAEDPDTAPELTDEWFDKADYPHRRHADQARARAAAAGGSEKARVVAAGSGCDRAIPRRRAGLAITDQRGAAQAPVGRAWVSRCDHATGSGLNRQRMRSRRIKSAAGEKGRRSPA